MIKVGIVGGTGYTGVSYCACLHSTLKLRLLQLLHVVMQGLQCPACFQVCAEELILGLKIPSGLI